MKQHHQTTCKLLGFLLEYPDAAWAETLTRVGPVVDALAEHQGRGRLRRFLAWAGETPEVRLQETYTAAFDLNPATSLNLTYHLMGDSEDRGKALARLLEVYRREGYDAAGSELPDYLPLVLEFLSVCPAPEDAEVLRASLGMVPVLAERLREDGHPYADLMGLAADTLEQGCGLVPRRRRKEA